MAPKQFTLYLMNNSLNNGEFCIYQSQPDLTTHGNPKTLAWYVLGCNPGCYAYFEWTVDYQLGWTQQGDLGKGIKFRTGGLCNADLDKGTRKILGMQGTSYTFKGDYDHGIPGTIGVNGDRTMANGKCHVSIAVNGRPAAAMPIGPNTAVTFRPKPNYYVTFGSFVQSEVVEVSTMVNSMLLDYAGQGVKHLAYSLNAQNKWVQMPADSTF